MSSPALDPIPPRSPEGAGQQQTVGEVVRQIVTNLLPDGQPDMHSVAEILRLSARTLQRRLYGEGLSFVGVVARTRCDVAQRMLGDPARKVIDVALDLGYSDPAHFTRAFVRWTGLTPREFRRLRSTDSDERRSQEPAPPSPGAIRFRWALRSRTKRRAFDEATH